MCNGFGRYSKENHHFSPIGGYWQSSSIVECEDCNGKGELNYGPFEGILVKGASDEIYTFFCDEFPSE
jgi:hypothetical protein